MTWENRKLTYITNDKKILENISVIKGITKIIFYEKISDRPFSKTND